MPWHIETVYVDSKDPNRSFKKEVESAIKGKQLVDIKYATIQILTGIMQNLQ